MRLGLWAGPGRPMGMGPFRAWALRGHFCCLMGAGYLFIDKVFPVPQSERLPKILAQALWGSKSGPQGAGCPLIGSPKHTHELPTKKYQGPSATQWIPAKDTVGTPGTSGLKLTTRKALHYNIKS